MSFEEALAEFSLESRALGRVMPVRLVLPPRYTAQPVEPYSVLYFLHPWGLSPRYVTDKLHIHEHLWQGVLEGALPPMVIVLPTGHKSFYLNAADPPGHDWAAVLNANERFFENALEEYGRYGDYFLQEVIPYVEQHYPVRRDGAGRAIGGISMGGAGAAVHALRAPEQFCALGIHSPALFSGPPENGGPPWIFGLEQETFEARDPVALAHTLSPETAPRIFLDTGDRDPMRAEVERLHRALAERGIPHVYEVPAGGHDKTYWEPRMRAYLAFYGRDW